MRGFPLSEERENGLILNAIFMLCPLWDGLDVLAIASCERTRLPSATTWRSVTSYAYTCPQLKTPLVLCGEKGLRQRAQPEGKSGAPPVPPSKACQSGR